MSTTLPIGERIRGFKDGAAARTLQSSNPLILLFTLHELRATSYELRATPHGSLITMPGRSFLGSFFTKPLLDS